MHAKLLIKELYVEEKVFRLGAMTYMAGTVSVVWLSGGVNIHAHMQISVGHRGGNNDCFQCFKYAQQTDL